MGTIRKNKSLRKKGGSGKLKLGIKDERGDEIFVPIKPDNKGNLYAEDKSGIDPHTGEKLSDFAQLRTDSPEGAPSYNPDWRKFDRIALKFKPKRGGKRKRTKRKYRKVKKTKKVKKLRKRRILK